MLCSVGTGKTPHIMNSLTKKELSTMLSVAEKDTFLRELNGKLIANESVIGASETQAKCMIFE
jgi:hypothetical protein